MKKILNTFRYTFSEKGRNEKLLIELKNNEKLLIELKKVSKIRRQNF